jgi:hypothetical protein
MLQAGGHRSLELLRERVTGKFSKAFPPAFTRAISWLKRIRFFIPEKRYPCSF